MPAAKIERFARIGLAAGLAVGLLLGFIIDGPYLHSSPPALLICVVIGTGMLGAFMGYMALAIIIGRLIRGDVGADFSVPVACEPSAHGFHSPPYAHHGSMDHHDCSTGHDSHC